MLPGCYMTRSPDRSPEGKRALQRIYALLDRLKVHPVQYRGVADLMRLRDVVLPVKHQLHPDYREFATLVDQIS